MRTILIVDDQAGVRCSLDYALSSAGFRVVTAASGAEALQVVAAEPILAAIVDVHMPQMDGFAVCRSLHERGLPVWMMTGMLTGAVTTRAAEVGARKVLHKPFQFVEVAAEIRSVLDAGATGTAPAAGPTA